MRFHVVGLGAVGSLIAHHLRRALPTSHSVSLIHRTRYKAREAIWRNGVTVDEHGCTVTQQGFTHGTASIEAVSRFTNEPDPKPETRYIESLFVSLKAHQTLPAIRHIAPRLTSESTIVLLQNGMGIHEQLLREVFRNPEKRPHFIIASNTHGVTSTGLLSAIHAGRGEIRFAIAPDFRGRNFEAGFHNTSLPVSDRRPSLSDISQSAESDPMFTRYRSLRNTVAALLLMETLNTAWLPMEEMQIALRRKLVVNAFINPVTAIFGCKNGGLLNSSPAHGLLRSVCEEAANVFKAESLAEAKDFMKAAGKDAAQDVLFDRVPESLSADSLQRECLRVAEATKDNISSMLSDIRLARASGTEINYINGHIVALGSLYGVFTPVNATLARMVRMRSRLSVDSML